ncbi:MAG: ROK family protein [Patescibacteria group bacterium]
MYLVFDIGGTNTRLAASDDGQTFGSPLILPTPKLFAEAMVSLQAAAATLTANRPLTAAAGGISGTLAPDRRTLVHATHLPDWVKQPLAAGLVAALGGPVVIENDAAVVGLGEAAAGAGKNYSVVVYVTVSTGVGGARIVDRRVDRRVIGFEPGFQIIDRANLLTLEDLISGTAIARRYGRPPRELTDPAIWDEAAALLAIGLHNSIVHWSPEVVILGGSMFKQPGIALEAVRQHLATFKTALGGVPEIKLAELGDLGGLHGGLQMLSLLVARS